jgi:hypothetical protein
MIRYVRKKNKQKQKIRGGRIMTAIIKKIVAVYKENQAQLICGTLAMNGATNVCQTYDILSR